MLALMRSGRAALVMAQAALAHEAGHETAIGALRYTLGALALAQSAMAQFYNQIGVLGEHVGLIVKIGITVTGVYLFVIGGVMQLFPTLGLKKT